MYEGNSSEEEDEEGGDEPDEPDEEEQLRTPNEYAKMFLNAAIADKRYIVDETVLVNTVKRLPCDNCGAPALGVTLTKKSTAGGGVRFEYYCMNQHKNTWSSTRWYGAKSLTGQLLVLCSLLAGLTYHQMAQFAKFLQLAFPARSTFFKLQRLFYKPLKTYYSKSMEETRTQTRAKVVAVDTRFDSPGYCASKATTVFMEYDTKAIVHAEFCDHRSTNRQSATMEYHNIQRGLPAMKDLQVEEIVSDASSVIKAALGEEDTIFHSMDLWHKGKNIAEMVLTGAKNKDCRALKKWAKPTVAHFWSCAVACKGDQEKMDRRWAGLLWHVQGIHEWTVGRCHHAPDKDASLPLLIEGSPDGEAFRKIIMNPNLLASLEYYSRARHTSSVENFFSHTLLHYAPKRIQFSYDGYCIRNMIAILDHNHNLTRADQLSSNGNPYINCQLSRRTKEWVAYKRMEAKEYSYIPDLLCVCLDGVYGVGNHTARLTDTGLYLRNLGKAQRKNPGAWTVFQQQESRGKHSSRQEPNRATE
ncbi:uncharacterized protein [Littorina saxatilis]|uniref:uncharacterized protein n=1 Tax=Littorina saxatilis TaxID=31220 RepID=UPI0038B5D37C